jgi:hypothetical protein
LDKLEALARAATPGEWKREDRTVYVLEPDGWRKGVEQFRNRFSCSVSRDGSSIPQDELQANAEFIAAANPATILALIALARKAAADAPAADERALFEAWASERWEPQEIGMRHRDTYIPVSLNAAWNAWQARAAHPIGQVSPAIGQAAATLKSYWTGGWWTGVSNDDLRRIEEAFATLAAPISAISPSGWKLVPLVCTPEMRAAWDRSPSSEDDDVDFHGAYRAMLDAAPAAISPSDEKGKADDANSLRSGLSEIIAAAIKDESMSLHSQTWLAIMAVQSRLNFQSPATGRAAAKDAGIPTSRASRTFDYVNKAVAEEFTATDRAAMAASRTGGSGDHHA